ncbi:MAG: M28 family peptidase [bacterium]|nr:M28 family peptidase [bacterium]
MKAVFMMLFLVAPVFAQDQSSLHKDMEFLTSPALKGRGAGTGSDMVAAIYVSERMKSLGYKVKIDSFSFVINGCTAQEAVSGVNVEAFQSGLIKNAKTIIIGAHLDGASPSEEGEFVPAADDNASGSAALLYLAEKLSKKKWNHNMMLVAFGAEEKGLCGSLYFVITHSRKNYLYMINMDMVGRPTDGSLSVYIEGDDENLELRRAFLEANMTRAVDLTVKLGEYTKNKWEWWSDHYAFSKHRKSKIPAVMVNDGHINDIHTPADSLDKIDFEYMEKVVNLVYEALVELDKKDPN